MGTELKNYTVPSYLLETTRTYQEKRNG